MIPTVARHHGGWNRIRQVPDPDCLRAIREGARLTRRALAARAGCRKEFVYQIETGVEPCSERLLRVYEEVRA